MLRCVSIDMGKYATKGAVYPPYNGEDRVYFKTHVDVGRMLSNNGLINTNNSHTVFYIGTGYLVGASASGTDIETDNKGTATHIIAAYTAIGLLTDPGDEVIVAIGCPLSFFKNKDAVVQFKKTVFPALGRYDIVVDGRQKSFNVVKVQVCPESSGPIFLNPEKYQEMSVGVIDIGGLNSNGCRYDEGYPILKSAFTNSFGGYSLINDLYNKIKEALSSKGHSNIEKDQLERDVRQGFCLVDKDLTRPIIQKAKEDAVNILLKETSTNHWGVDNMYVTFIGGTARLLKPEIMNAFPHVVEDCFSQDMDFINALGFLRLIKGMM